jgi:hypothetical protein
MIPATWEDNDKSVSEEVLKVPRRTIRAHAQQCSMAVRPMVAVLALRKVQCLQNGCLHYRKTYKSIPSQSASRAYATPARYMHHLHERQNHAADQQILTLRFSNREEAMGTYHGAHPVELA